MRGDMEPWSHGGALQACGRGGMKVLEARRRCVDVERHVALALARPYHITDPITGALESRYGYRDVAV